MQHALRKQQQISITKIAQMATQTHHGELESRSNHLNDLCAQQKAVASDTAGMVKGLCSGQVHVSCACGVCYITQVMAGDVRAE